MRNKNVEEIVGDTELEPADGMNGVIDDDEYIHLKILYRKW